MTEDEIIRKTELTFGFALESGRLRILRLILPSSAIRVLEEAGWITEQRIDSSWGCTRSCYRFQRLYYEVQWSADSGIRVEVEFKT